MVGPHDRDRREPRESDAGPGTNASPRGGILTVNGPGEPNDALITVPGWSLNNGNATLPAEGNGNWSHAYFEAYIQSRIDGNSSTSPSSGWPAFWSWSMQGLRNFGFGGSSLTTANYSEIDFYETYGTIFGNQPGNWTATMHQWPANVSSDGHTQHTDSGWHTYGCLWISTGTGDRAGEVLLRRRPGRPDRRLRERGRPSSRSRGCRSSSSWDRARAGT
jgi:hypothetical protein